MKTKGLFLTAILAISTVALMAQEKETKNYIWEYQREGKTKTLGVYGGIFYSYSEIMDKSAGYLGAEVGVVFNQKWGVGLSGAAINFDYNLDELVNDGTYRLEGGHTGMFVKYIIPFSGWGKINLSVYSGYGSMNYRYNKEYRDERPWYQEIIDTETYAVLEPGIELDVRIARKWWVGAKATYVTTSPVELMGVDENFLENFAFGLSLKYGIF
ncbi:MAG: hypothetical protein V2I54_09170 [Bacteroidales bacterium]|nr:hypothetical protein [Bacteroidales bacterium]